MIFNKEFYSNEPEVSQLAHFSLTSRSLLAHFSLTSGSGLPGILFFDTFSRNLRHSFFLESRIIF
jgi:hypothetical protein